MSVRSLVTKRIRGFERPFDVLNRIEVSESAILKNFDTYTNILDGVAVFPVLKANAYGHGITVVANILKKRTFPYLVVDGYFEALKIREVSDQAVLLLGYVDPANYQNMDLRNTAVVVHDSETVKALGDLKRKVTVHVKVDTGMHRLGVYPDEVGGFVKEIMKYPTLKIEGIMSHLSSADDDDQTFTNDQMAKFREAVEEVQTLVGEKLPYVHVGASSGSLKVPSGTANAARIGLGLYGIQPFHEKSSYAEKLTTLRPALRLVSKIISVKEINNGDKVSYSGTFVADRDMRIGILPLGYYEGIDWRLSNRGVVMVNGSYACILGRVCMNVVVVDLSDIDAGWMDEVVVIDDERDSKNSVEAIARTCETIPYDILVHLNESVRRVVVG